MASRRGATRRRRRSAPGTPRAKVAAAARTTSRVACVFRSTSRRLIDRPCWSGCERQRVRLLRLPAELLLHPADLAVELGRDRRGAVAFLQDEVDHAVDRPVDRHLRRGAPSRVELAEQRLAHGHLEVVPDPRPGVREVPHAEVRPKRHPDPLEDQEARLGVARLDVRQVRPVDPRDGSNGALAASRVLAICRISAAEPTQLLAVPSCQESLVDDRHARSQVVRAFAAAYRRLSVAAADHLAAPAVESPLASCQSSVADGDHSDARPRDGRRNERRRHRQRPLASGRRHGGGRATDAQLERLYEMRVGAYTRRPVVARTVDPLAPFGPAVRAWFEATFEAPTKAQADGWAAISRGEHTLIHAPTGSGKTLAAFLWCLDRLVHEPSPTPTKAAPGTVRTLYVSPAEGPDLRRGAQPPRPARRHRARGAAAGRGAAADLDRQPDRATRPRTSGATSSATRRTSSSRRPRACISCSRARRARSCAASSR